MRKARSSGALVCFCISGLCAFSLFVGLSAICSQRNDVASVHPDPLGRAASAFDRELEDGRQAEYPLVDWDYWHDMNPSIVGWITIPGTPIDYPIVQADMSDADYYLTHDVYGRVNYCGCPFIDAACDTGANSRNCVVSAHNLGDGGNLQFECIAHYADEAYARSHDRVLLQTPDWKREFSVAFVDVEESNALTMKTSFRDNADFSAWWTQCATDANVSLAVETAAPEHVLTLSTCSYGAPDERTLVFAAEAPPSTSSNE